MRDQSVDLGRSGLDESLRGESDGSTSVCHVVDEDGDLSGDASDEDHSRLKQR